MRKTGGRTYIWYPAGDGAPSKRGRCPALPKRSASRRGAVAEASRKGEMRVDLLLRQAYKRGPFLGWFFDIVGRGRDAQAAAPYGFAWSAYLGKELKQSIPSARRDRAVPGLVPG